MQSAMNKLGSIKTTVMVGTLIMHLQDHKATHVAAYSLAVEAYQSKYISTLEEFLQQARAGSFKQVPFNLGLIEPINRVEMYDDLINTLKFMHSSSVEMTLEELNTVVNDSWDWALSAKTANSFYAMDYAADSMR